MSGEVERWSTEVCYCSTLGECWTSRVGGLTPNTTTGTRRCPGFVGEYFPTVMMRPIFSITLAIDRESD